MKIYIVTEKMTAERVSYVNVKIENFNDYFTLKLFTENVSVFKNFQLSVSELKIYCNENEAIANFKVFKYYMKKFAMQ